MVVNKTFIINMIYDKSSIFVFFLHLTFNFITFKTTLETMLWKQASDAITGLIVHYQRITHYKCNLSKSIWKFQ